MKPKIIVKKKLVFGIITVILFFIAIIGYSFEEEKVPVRVAFETKGGGVIFNHQYHTSLKKMKCQECHHNFKENKTKITLGEMNCRECHYSKDSARTCAKEAIHKRCIGKKCQACHVENSVKCNFCHNAENFIPVLEPKIVKFDTDGGLVKFDHEKHSDGLDCNECHHGYTTQNSRNFPMNCRQCHYNKKYESLCENEDTHIRCIGKNCIDCHEDSKENCEKCHKE